MNPTRVTLDNTVALIHIKFPDEATRAEYLQAFSGQEQSQSGAVVIDTDLYPIKLGKYWLGPLDPTRPHDDPSGGYGKVKGGIDSETGERVCCKQNRHLTLYVYEGQDETGAVVMQIHKSFGLAQLPCCRPSVRILLALLTPARLHHFV